MRRVSDSSHQYHCQTSLLPLACIPLKSAELRRGRWHRRCRFKLLPTAFTFAEGHCLRLAVTGADGKHFAVDHQGPRSLWLYAGGSCASALHLPEIDHVPAGRR